MRFASIVGLTALAALGGTPVEAQRDPCALLTTAEVQQVLPGSKAGQPDRRLDKQGIYRCRWEYQGNHVTVISGDEATESPREEAETWVLAFIDPLRGDASRVRYAVLKGVGDEAVAIVERPDTGKGIAQNGAVVVVRRGAQQVSVLAPHLARRDRAAALEALAALGKAVAGRMGGARGR